MTRFPLGSSVADQTIRYEDGELFNRFGLVPVPPANDFRALFAGGNLLGPEPHGTGRRVPPVAPLVWCFSANWFPYSSDRWLSLRHYSHRRGIRVQRVIPTLHQRYI